MSIAKKLKKIQKGNKKMKNTIFSLILIISMLLLASCSKDGKDTTSNETKAPATSPVTTPQTEKVTEERETEKVTLQNPLDAISDMLTESGTDSATRRKK